MSISLHDDHDDLGYNLAPMATVPDIPKELQQLSQWVCWKVVKRKGKLTKLPFRLDDPKEPASSTDPSTWGTFAKALKALKNKDLSGIAGIGFVFSPDDPYCGVDLDNAVADGRILPWAQAIVDQLMPTYAEISPSGTGIKFWVRAELPGKGTRKGDFAGPETGTAVEIYDKGRFFATTGRIIDHQRRGIEDRAEYVLELYDQVKPKSTKKAKPPEDLRDIPVVSMGDAELVAKAERAKNGDKFRALFDGSTTGYPSKSEADLALCSMLAFWAGGDQTAIDRIFRQSRLFDEKWERESYRVPTIDKACDRATHYDPSYRRSAPDPAPRPPLGIAQVEDDGPPEDDDLPPTDGGDGDDEGGPPGRPRRPSIEINAEWHQGVSKGITALGSDPDLYCRGGQLVKIVRESGDIEKVTGRTAFRDVAGTPKVMGLSESNVGVRLTTVATFFKWKEDKNGELISIRCGPPPWLIKSISTHGHWAGIRPLLAVAECPFPRPDGSIVETAGYDTATATILLPSIEFPPIPPRPTRDDAREAWARLVAYVEDFPFASDDDRVVWLAGLLTVVARPAIEGPVPGFAVIGNKAGTGKGLLIDTMTIPGTGRVCPTSAYPDEKDEAVKVKVSIAKAGKVAVHFDNLDEGDSYGSGPLDSALTATVVDDRQLGSNDSPPLPLRTAWFLSGNNVTPAKDAYRRWLPIHIKSDLEKPEERTDIKRPKLRSDMIAARGEIVRDALIILRAHSINGRPQKPEWPGFGSFEDWSEVVRGAVWYATGCDCLATQRSTSASSPERMKKIALLEGLAELPGAVWGKGKGVTAREAIEMVEGNTTAYETLRGALVNYGRAGKLATSGSLGNILSGLKDNLIDGYRLRDGGQKHKVALWMVEVLEGPDRGVYGSGGSSSGPPTRDSDPYTDMLMYGEDPKPF